MLARAEELDALDAILPFTRRDQLATLLTDDDVATLKHLAKEGMGENMLRALTSDLGYLEAWCELSTGAPSPGRRRKACSSNSSPITFGTRPSEPRIQTTACRPRSRLDCEPRGCCVPTARMHPTPCTGD